MRTVAFVSVIETMSDIERGVEALTRAEPRFAEIVAVTGLPPLRRRGEPFPALLDIIVAQQLSKASADAIWRRMEASLKPFDAARLLSLDDQDFRAAGLSRPKIRTIRALSQAVCDGALDFDALDGLDDSEIHARLTAISGIGPWTADIYLLSCLGRADAWPCGDLALQIAAAEAFGLDQRPDKEALVALAAPWRPWRAIAARLLWAHYSAARAARKQQKD